VTDGIPTDRVAAADRLDRLPSAGAAARTRAVAAALMWVGGFVDALGFLLLRGVYLGNMTGDTVGAGIAAVHRDWRELLTRVQPILGFGIGLLAGAVAQDVARRVGGRRLLTLALGLEAVCLAVVGLLPGGDARLRILLGAAAMGVQNTSLRNSGILSLYTTHVTGLLTELSEYLSSVVAGLTGIPHHRRAPELFGPVAASEPLFAPATGPAARAPGRTALGLALLYGVWVTGVVSCAALLPTWGRAIVWIPVAVVSAVAVTDLLRPIAPAGASGDAHTPATVVSRSRA